MTSANTAPRPDETENARDDIPNPETGVGIGADAEPDTFEPEETPEQA
jgi:hypothetical protein